MGLKCVNYLFYGWITCCDDTRRFNRGAPFFRGGCWSGIRGMLHRSRGVNRLADQAVGEL